MELEAASGSGAVQTTVCKVPLSTVTGSADGDSRSDTHHSLS
ncbi:MAG: hypothetical protein WA672_17735 [Candidatus Angelobacter sp.]